MRGSAIAEGLRGVLLLLVADVRRMSCVFGGLRSFGRIGATVSIGGLSAVGAHVLVRPVILVAALVCVVIADRLGLGEVSDLGLRYLIIGISLYLVIQVRYLLSAIEDRFADAALRIGIHWDLELVAAHVAHTVERLVARDRRLGHWLVEIVAIMEAVGDLGEPRMLLTRVVYMQ